MYLHQIDMNSTGNRGQTWLLSPYYTSGTRRVTSINKKWIGLSYDKEKIFVVIHETVTQTFCNG